jgi:pimeloyl-ACP methyl ester carboxylesterase
MNGALALASASGVATCRGVIAVAPPQQLPADREALQANWEANAEPRRKQRAAELITEYEAADEEAKPEIFRLYDNLRRWHDFDTAPEDAYEYTPEIGAWVSAVIASGADVDWPATFTAVEIPVLLALGKYDFLVPLSSWRTAVPRPNWTVEVFERSGHSPFVEQSDEFVAAAEPWLAGLTL